MTGLFDVTMIAYCGLVYDIVRGVDRTEAVAVAKRFRERRKKEGCEVSFLGGMQWEIITPDDAFMIQDTHGFLKVRASKE